jgi:hypothetical protein
MRDSFAEPKRDKYTKGGVIFDSRNVQPHTNLLSARAAVFLSLIDARKYWRSMERRSYFIDVIHENSPL